MLNRIDIRQLRKARHMTQSGLGLLCGMDKSQISRMENGFLGSPETVSRVLAALGYELRVEVIDNRQGLSGITDMLALYKFYNAKRLGIVKLGLFGSYARGEQTENSDVDVCISLDSPSLYKYAAIRSELESLFRKKVDLVPLSAGMTQEFKNEMDKDVIYV